MKRSRPFALARLSRAPPPSPPLSIRITKSVRVRGRRGPTLGMPPSPPLSMRITKSVRVRGRRRPCPPPSRKRLKMARARCCGLPLWHPFPEPWIECKLRPWRPCASPWRIPEGGECLGEIMSGREERPGCNAGTSKGERLRSEEMGPFLFGERGRVCRGELGPRSATLC